MVGAERRVAAGATTAEQSPAAGLTWDVPSAWQPVPPPPHSPRRAQYRVGRQEGDPADGEVVVFHFAGGGGSVEENVRRWAGQFRKADGGPVETEDLVRETYEAGGLTVHLVEIAGFYAAGAMMGGSDRPSEIEYRLLGGIVETPDGPWFFKATGPAATMAAARDDFRRMLRSVRQQ